ncbi:DMT family transporter [Candidatus Mycobacterium wuenschmannii]|uniref:DMT family transporter n=1 Tax=Candidatus Mycobacterium wuenschmannii TaxID=3027808 RepID=A0ABY8W085_9MYCO|nr:DMT family transporter [Candidatus Mycobacterium wuenschmannii]WIM88409.1 DMT family transporter [Candidatus Mycobacterium wuenschmannii]
MTTAEYVAALIALCAALASAIGDVIRQRSAQEVTDKEVGHLELFWLSVRDPRWWMGGMGAVANYSLQAVALALGSVILVTALQVTSLLFALPIYARLAHHRVTRWEWTWAVLLAGSLAVLVTVGDPDAGVARASLRSWLIVIAVMGPILVLCVLGARIWARSVAAPVLLAVVAGSALALFAVLTKGAVGAASGGFGAFLRAPESYGLLPAALVGMIFQQSAFRAGALTASLPTVTVAKPTVASLLGVLVLGETLGTTGPKVLALIVAGVLVVIATIALARGEAATMAAGTGQDVAAPEKQPTNQ